MLSGKHQLDEIGPWSEAKLDILKDYAGAYMTVLANQSVIKRVVYIDAFAGAGTHISRQTGKKHQKQVNYTTIGKPREGDPLYPV